MIKDRINSMYGNIDQMIRKTGTFLSRSYLYLIVNNCNPNITLKVMLELKKLLQIDTMDELLIMLNYDEK